MVGDSRYSRHTRSKANKTQRNQTGPLGQGPTVMVFHQYSEKLISGCSRREIA